MRYFRLLTLLSALLFSASVLYAQDGRSAVSGRVVSEEGGEGLTGVSITVKGTRRGTTTGADGSFIISLGTGEKELIVSHAGFETQVVDGRGGAAARVVLRITALFVFVASVSYFIAPSWIIPAFLGVDFFLRGFGKGRYSPLNVWSGWVVGRLSVKNKPIDQAPKVFAARLGFVFSGLLLVSDMFFPWQAAFAIAAILVLFSFLESALGFCAGCHVYSLIKKLFYRGFDAAA